MNCACYSVNVLERRKYHSGLDELGEALPE